MPGHGRLPCTSQRWRHVPTFGSSVLCDAMKMPSVAFGPIWLRKRKHRLPGHSPVGARSRCCRESGCVPPRTCSGGSQVWARVLVEKPFSDRAVGRLGNGHESARRARRLVIALGWRYQPMVMAAKDFMEGKSGVGAIEHIAISMSSPTREALLGQTCPICSRQSSRRWIRLAAG